MCAAKDAQSPRKGALRAAVLWLERTVFMIACMYSMNLGMRCADAARVTLCDPGGRRGVHGIRPVRPPASA
eukprot:7379643-Prymnesium_polylepis.2